MRKIWEQPQITPLWATSTTLLLPPRRKQRVIRNNSGDSTERTSRVSQLIRYFLNFFQHKIYITHTLLIAQIQIQREYPPFIRKFSNGFFPPHKWSDKNKQTNKLVPLGMHNSRSSVGHGII